MRILSPPRNAIFVACSMPWHSCRRPICHRRWRIYKLMSPRSTVWRSCRCTSTPCTLLELYVAAIKQTTGVCFCAYVGRRRYIHPVCGTCTLLSSQAWRRQTMSVRGGTIRSARWLGISTQHCGPCWVLCNRTKRWLQPPSSSTPEVSRRRNVRSAPPCSNTICAAESRR